jgi:hypothetical protein
MQRAKERIIGEKNIAIADTGRAAHDRAQRVANGTTCTSDPMRPQ